MLKEKQRYKHQDTSDTYIYVLQCTRSYLTSKTLVRARIHNLVQDTFYEVVHFVLDDSDLYKWIEVSEKDVS